MLNSRVHLFLNRITAAHSGDRRNWSNLTGIQIQGREELNRKQTPDIVEWEIKKLKFKKLKLRATDGMHISR